MIVINDKGGEKMVKESSEQERFFLLTSKFVNW